MEKIDPELLRMTIKVINQEKICVMRNIQGLCNRDCKKCDLVLPDSEIISAYNVALAVLYTLEAEQNNNPLQCQ